MPKLNKQQAKAVQNTAPATAGGYMLDDGLYAAQLLKVEEKEGNEYPYWSWEFGNIHDKEGARKGGRQWNNTSLSPKSEAFLAQSFEAFGYTADSDTDEMIGEWVVLSIGSEIQKKGAKAGQRRNVVLGLLEFKPDKWDFDPEEAAEEFKQIQAKRATAAANTDAEDDSY